MRRVTAKPPNMLTAVSTMPAKASHWMRPSGRPLVPASGGRIWTNAPITMMDRRLGAGAWQGYQFEVRMERFNAQGIEATETMLRSPECTA